MIFKDLNTRTADVVIAASNSSDKMKKGADYVCTGSDDQEVINKVLQECNVGDWKQRTILLANGNFYISDSIIIPNQVNFIGQGGLNAVTNIWAADGLDGTKENVPVIKIDPTPATRGLQTIKGFNTSMYNYRLTNDFNIGIDLTNSDYGLIHLEDLQIADCNKYGITIGSGGLIRLKDLYIYVSSGVTTEAGINLEGTNTFYLLNSYIRRYSTGIKLSNSVARGVITNNIFRDITTTSIDRGTSTSLIIKNNQGASGEGTATVPNGATSVTVTHNLKRTPLITEILVTPTNNMGNAAKYWISDIGATTFKINVNADPGTTTATFVWQVL